ncbi:MAG TPA: helix-hairpin-helix domain-containing protein, partial [Actinomycetota bacterium]|nr:helix-hairpin-helix domain-containing protein [Actinomycetota bacterium]
MPTSNLPTNRPTSNGPSSSAAGGPAGRRPASNAEIAAALHELAELLQIDGGDRFRIQAYRRAADAISIAGRPLAMMSDAELTAVRGIGAGTAAKVKEYLASGSMAALERLRERYPPGVLEMTRLAGMGPKKALAIHQALGVTSLEELREAIAAGRLSEVPGFGAKAGENLLQALDRYASRDRRVPMIDALQVAGEVLALLRAMPGVERATYAGSLRRMRDTIGDLDILVASETPGPILAAFPALP